MKWVDALPLILNALENPDQKAFARQQLEVMALAADRKPLRKRSSLPNREKIIEVLVKADRPMPIREISAITGIPGTKFAAIRRDDQRTKVEPKIVRAINTKGRPMSRYAALSDWGVEKSTVEKSKKAPKG